MSPAAPAEFHYRLPAVHGGQRPGAHRGSSLGAGLVFAAHRRLFDHPDPRRIDLRASLRDPHGEWLVRLPRQRVAVAVHVLVDVSASMHFGARRRKLEVVADFVEALGRSAYRSGDALGLLAFDHGRREDLDTPARHSRGAGLLMADALRRCRAEPADQHDRAHELTPRALQQAAAPLAGRAGLVFLVSDFHWPLAPLHAVLEQLAPACVLPIVAWDPAEIEAPAAHALVAVSDAETGERRTLWMRKPLRRRWAEAVARRRAELHALFDAHGLAPFELQGRFDAEALTRHFIEAVA
ncbi:MxaS protein [Rubrivivax gelatinosus]|nr:MxaS protein [Rubrivivax gelatinosus]